VAMTPILSLLPVKDGFDFMSPEAEAYQDFKTVTDPLARQAKLLGAMRGALILYHKQTLARLGELAAPIVQMDMQSITPDDIGTFASPSDPCDHCQARRAVVRCINCAAVHCERCTLWLHRQTGFRHHRCRPIFPKGMTEGLLMTRQARAAEAAKVERAKLEAFPAYVERLRRVMRRVESRKVGAQPLVLSEPRAQPRLDYVELVPKAQHRSPRVLGPGAAVADAAEEEAAREQRQLLAPRHTPQGLLQHVHHGFCGQYIHRHRHCRGSKSKFIPRIRFFSKKVVATCDDVTEGLEG